MERAEGREERKEEQRDREGGKEKGEKNERAVKNVNMIARLNARIRTK